MDADENNCTFFSEAVSQLVTLGVTQLTFPITEDLFFEHHIGGLEARGANRSSAVRICVHARLCTYYCVMKEVLDRLCRLPMWKK